MLSKTDPVGAAAPHTLTDGLEAIQNVSSFFINYGEYIYLETFLTIFSYRNNIFSILLSLTSLELSTSSTSFSPPSIL